MSTTRRTTRRTARALLVAATATALALPATAAVATTRTTIPTYACDQLRPEGPQVGRWIGSADCKVAQGHLPDHGPVHAEFKIRMRGGGSAVLCDFVGPGSGFADLPDSVEGYYCSPIHE